MMLVGPGLFSCVEFLARPAHLHIVAVIKGGSKGTI